MSPAVSPSPTERIAFGRNDSESEERKVRLECGRIRRICPNGNDKAVPKPRNGSGLKKLFSKITLPVDNRSNGRHLDGDVGWLGVEDRAVRFALGGFERALDVGDQWFL